MSTLAENIVIKIKNNDKFKDDLRSLFADSYKIKIESQNNDNQTLTESSPPSLAHKRLVETAYLLSQANNDADKNLAQSIAYHINSVSEDQILQKITVELLQDLGNFPGAKHLKELHDSFSEDFYSYLRSNLLENTNKVNIDNVDYILTDFQKKIWDSIDNKDPQAISAPTSAGKSFIVLEMLVTKIISGDYNYAIYLAPTRALVNEISEKILRKTQSHSGKIRVSTIPTISNDYEKQIFVLTQERLQILLEILDNDIDIVIIDESQSIGDDIRGMILQDCLDQISNKKNKIKYLFLAPGAEGFSDFSNIIGVDEISIERTDYSPVVQNKIIVNAIASDENSLNISLLNNAERIPLGKIKSKRGFANPSTRLAAIALELGGDSGSLVYGTGAAKAEGVAKQIASDLEVKDDKELLELSKFIKKHVHKDYSLASHVLRGVAYHYGKMPSLLRECLEKGFINNKIKFLVCTTTLFQGVNLPAKNVFIDTPTRGNRGDKLDAAALWNFAGRAGRLGYEFSGNVFLVDYDTWETTPLDSKMNYSITSSFKKIISEDFDSVIARLDKSNHMGLSTYSGADAAAGLLISRAAKGELDKFLSKSFKNNNLEDKTEILKEQTLMALDSLSIPHEVLAVNWTVDPFGQERLYNRFLKKIDEGKVDELIPLHPSGDVYKVYVGVFSRINKYILNGNTPKFSNYLTSMALIWMRGKSLPEIISLSLKHKTEKSKTGKVNVDRVVREVFEFIEDNLRFKYVQLGRAYIDLLRIALHTKGLTKKAKEIYDFPLSLELGVSSIAGQVFIELGISRISASFLEGLIPDSNPSIEDARIWLKNLAPTGMDIPSIISRELEGKGLIP